MWGTGSCSVDEEGFYEGAPQDYNKLGHLRDSKVLSMSCFLGKNGYPISLLSPPWIATRVSRHTAVAAVQHGLRIPVLLLYNVTSQEPRPNDAFSI